MSSTCKGAHEASQEPGNTLSAAQRARIEHNRLRARTLQDARLVKQPPKGETVISCASATRALDSGGGFLLEPSEDAAPRLAARPAPLVHASEQPRCLNCDRLFPQSYLFDTFDYSVCDECRDDDEAHSLVTRTEAKNEYLLKDCDLDSRPPPLRCVRRRNPHRAHYSEMRLYLRVQVEARALEVWGSAAQLEVEREARRERRQRAQRTLERRRLRALRMDVRSSLYEHARVDHVHSFGPERYHADADEYERECTGCGHKEVYEKM